MKRKTFSLTINIKQYDSLVIVDKTNPRLNVREIVQQLRQNKPTINIKQLTLNNQQLTLNNQQSTLNNYAAH